MSEINKDFYIFGEPVETDLGEVRFLTYKEYLMNISQLSMMSLNVLHIYYEYRKMFDSKDEEAMSTVEMIKEESLYSIVMNSENFHSAYKRIFNMVLDSEDVVDKVFESEDDFMYYRGLVMDMQMLHEEDVSPNPEVQEFIERGRRVKSADQERQSFSDIISSIAVGSPHTYKDISNMTVLQVYSTYYRIGAMKNHDVTVLYSTVAEKVTIEAWNKHIDLFDTKKDVIKKTDFDKQYGGLF